MSRHCLTTHTATAGNYLLVCWQSSKYPVVARRSNRVHERWIKSSCMKHITNRDRQLNVEKQSGIFHSNQGWGGQDQRKITHVFYFDGLPKVCINYRYINQFYPVLLYNRVLCLFLYRSKEQDPIQVNKKLALFVTYHHLV